jgi:hypothetical protein
LLWILGVGILCYIPKSVIVYGEKKQEAAEIVVVDVKTAAEKSVSAMRRSIIIRFICGVTLILYGLKIVFLG